MSESVKVAAIPACDICKHVKHVEKSDSPKPAAYDGRTTQGSWAYMCEEHFASWGVGLGTGFGQRLILDADDDDL